MHTLPGINILRRSHTHLLRCQRVGLITNHTGVTSEGQPTVDVLHAMPGVTLAALFGPEHGVRGAYDQSHIDDSIDPATGVPVYSLYGARTAPDASQLQNIDTLVFDIQDIGCRFYTYISTLREVLKAAHAHNIPVVVLDRPNPITGLSASGPLPDTDKLSFTAAHAIPVRHGLTVGEIARLVHREMDYSCPLTVIPCEGWERTDWYDAAGLLWINPSPNMRSLAQATLYPGVGLLEMTNVSVGRGTNTPFEIVGAPWIESRTLAFALTEQKQPGIVFVPVAFTPRASVHAGETCGGVQFIVTARDAFDPIRLGLTLAQTLHALYPTRWEHAKFITLLANQSVYEQTLAGWNYDRLAAVWADDLAQFTSRCQNCLLY